MVANPENGSSSNEPVIIVNGKTYGPVNAAPAAAPAPLSVIIDGTPYVLQGTSFPAAPVVAQEVPVTPEVPAAPTGSTFSPVPPTVPGQVNTYLNHTATTPAVPPVPMVAPPTALPVGTPGTQPVSPADPMSAALDAVLAGAAAPTRQFPAPSWAAVAVFALVLGAFITFVICGIEVGAALGALALIGMIAAHIRRGLS
ncbi:hypothetical protein ACWC2H_21200 [Streptomyces sp. 900105755]